MMYEPAATAVANDITADNCLVTASQPQFLTGVISNVLKVFDSIVLDPNNNFDTDQSRYVVPADGDYFVAAYARGDNLAMGKFNTFTLRKNGNTNITFVLRGWEPPVGWMFGGCSLKLLTLTADDYLELILETDDTIQRQYPAGLDNCGFIVFRIF